MWLELTLLLVFYISLYTAAKTIELNYQRYIDEKTS